MNSSPVNRYYVDLPFTIETLGCEVYMLKTGYQVSPLFTWVQHLGTNIFSETVELIMQLAAKKLLYDDGLFVCKC